MTNCTGNTQWEAAQGIAHTYCTTTLAGSSLGWPRSI